MSTGKLFEKLVYNRLLFRELNNDVNQAEARVQKAKLKIKLSNPLMIEDLDALLDAKNELERVVTQKNLCESEYRNLESEVLNLFEGIENKRVSFTVLKDTQHLKNPNYSISVQKNHIELYGEGLQG